MQSTKPLTQTQDRVLTAIGLAALVAVMVLPLFMVQSFGSQRVAPAALAGTSAATAALAAFFRAGARQIVRSTLMTAARATTRTASRRAVRSLLPTMVRLLLPGFSRPNEERSAVIRSQVVRLGIGFAGLAVSFGVVVWLKGNGDALTGGLGLLVGSLLAALPVVFHYAFLVGATRLRDDVDLTLHVAADGMLVQAYFSIAGSFLPILTDIELTGSRVGKGICAGGVLVAFLLGHFAFSFAATATGVAPFEWFAGVLLLYAFVFAFPLHPLDGRDVWDLHPLIWLAMWGAIAWTFVARLPEAFHGIL